MKIVFICNKDYEDKITRPNDGKGFDFCGVHIRFEKEQQGRSVNEWDKDTKIVSDFDDFSPKEINSYFKSGYFAERQVFVMPELLWNDCSVDEGYKIACELFEKLTEKKQNQKTAKPFVLHFLSNFTQDQLRRMVSKKNQPLVDAFPHICINDIKNGRWKNVFQCKPEAYSETHFHLIRNIAVSASGRLEYIEHQLRNVPTAIDDKKNHFLRWIDALNDDAFQFDGLNEQIQKLKDLVITDCPTDLVNTEVVSGYVNKVVGHINNLIGLIRIHLLPKTDKTGIPNQTKKPFNVLIVDDNAEQREKLQKLFEQQYDHVSHNNNGTTFDIYNSEKAQSWMKKHAKDYQIIILDLLFTLPGTDTWLTYNGLDLYEVIKKNAPYSAVRIITSLPRHTVGSICDIELNHIITKSKGWEQLEGCLYDRLEGINEECKMLLQRKEENEGIRRPSLGTFFSNEAVKKRIEDLRTMGQFDDIFTTAITQSQSNQVIKLMGKSYKIKSNDEIDQYFGKFLAHRLSFLRWVAEECTFNCSKYNTGLRSIQNNTKSYFNLIGFSFIDKGPGFTQISMYTLFPEEYAYYREHLNTEKLLIGEENKQTLSWYYLILAEIINNEIDSKKYHFIESVTSCQPSELTFGLLGSFYKSCQHEIAIKSTEKIVSLINAITKIENLKNNMIDFVRLKEELNNDKVLKNINWC